MYEIFKVVAETFAKNCFRVIKVNKTDNKSVLWIKMIDIQKKLDVKNIHDPVDNEIKGKCKTDNLTDEQIKIKCFIISVIMHCRTPKSCKFKKSLGFKLNDVINCKKQTALGSLKDAF